MKKLSRPSLTPEVIEMTKPKKRSKLKRLITATILASALTCSTAVPQISYAATASSQAQAMVNTIYSTNATSANYKLTVDSVDMTSKVNFVAQNNRSMIGLRDFATVLGCTVDWDTNKVAIIKKGSTTIEVPIGSPQILVNGQPKNIDDQGTLSIILDSRTYLPFRIIAESLGYTVGYDTATKTIILKSAGSQTQTPQQPAPTVENKYGVQIPDGMENTTWLSQYNAFRDKYGMTDAQAQQNMAQIHPAPAWEADNRNKGKYGIMSLAQAKHYDSYDNAIRKAVDEAVAKYGTTVGTELAMPTEPGAFLGEMRGEWRFNGEAGWTYDLSAYTGLDAFGS